jgi:hypothetical protein
MGLIVSFNAGTVQGFGTPTPSLLDYPIKITAINEVTIAFGGSTQLGGSELKLLGTIDRMTGEVEANQTFTDSNTGKSIGSTAYSLKCRPTQRMF